MSATRRAAFFLIALLSAVAARVAAQPPQEADYIVRATASPCLRFRPVPDADAQHTDCLVPGTRVTAFESIPYWRRVRLADGRNGWVSKQFLELAPAVVAPPAAIPANAWLTVHFVDVGQGDAIWIATHDDNVAGNGIFEGRNIVIDGGPDSLPSANHLVRYMLERAHPGAVVDALIVTHPHSDHYYGAKGVLRSFQVRSYYDPGQPSTLTTYGGLLTAARAETVDGEPARVLLGTSQFGTLDWGSELRAEILYAWSPTATGLGSGGTRVNNASIVLRLEYGAHSFLFTGDLEGKHRGDPAATAGMGEALLLQTVPADRLRATVLKVAHHGSETSSTLPFLQTVSPEYVVITSGRRSFSGTFLPDASVITRLCALGDVMLLRTDQNDIAEGRTASTDADADHVVIRTNGTAIEVHAFSNGVEIPSPQRC